LVALAIYKRTTKINPSGSERSFARDAETWHRMALYWYETKRTVSSYDPHFCFNEEEAKHVTHALTVNLHRKIIVRPDQTSLLLNLRIFRTRYFK